MEYTASENGTEPHVVTTEAITAAVIAGEGVPMSALRDFYDRSFGEVSEAIINQGLRHTTAGFGRYFGQPTDTVDLEVGFGTDREVRPEGDVRASVLPAGRAARVVHVGSYEGLGESWGKLYDWIVSQGLTAADWMWEEYVTMPTPQTDPEELRTVLTWPLQG